MLRFVKEAWYKQVQTTWSYLHEALEQAKLNVQCGKKTRADASGVVRRGFAGKGHEGAFCSDG